MPEKYKYILEPSLNCIIEPFNDLYYTNNKLGYKSFHKYDEQIDAKRIENIDYFKFLKYNAELDANLYGLIDSNGNEVLKPYFKDIKFDFNNTLGFATVQDENGKYGIIDKVCSDADNIVKWAFDPIYEDIYDFHRKGYAIGRTDLAKGNADYIVLYKYEDCLYSNVFNTPSYSFESIFDYKGDVIFKVGLINKESEEKDNMRFINKNNTVVYFEEEQTEYKKKFGLMNEKCKWIVPPKYDSIWAFQPNGLMLARKNSSAGIININNKEVFFKDDENVRWLKNDIACIKKGLKYGLIKLNEYALN